MLRAMKTRQSKRTGEGTVSLGDHRGLSEKQGMAVAQEEERSQQRAWHVPEAARSVWLEQGVR